MNKFSIKNHRNNKTFYCGYYTSFIDCVEDAVSKKVDLSYANFKNNNLSNANLDGAHMPNADFNGCNLTGSNLSESSLQNSSFINCTLYNTCFSYSNLSSCDFRGADFGATLTEYCNISASTFSTLSFFDLNFQLLDSMEHCVYQDEFEVHHPLSNPPILIKGLFNTPVIIMDHVVKIGEKTFPKKVIPHLMRIIHTHAPILYNGKAA